MTLFDIDTKDMNFLKITDMENIFNIYVNKDGNYFYNLNNSLYLNIAEDSLLTFTSNYEMQWPLLSYKIYGTTRLAWLLMKINNVHPKDVFKMIQIGDKIKYLDKEQMSSLIAQLNKIS